MPSKKSPKGKAGSLSRSVRSMFSSSPAEEEPVAPPPPMARRKSSIVDALADKVREKVGGKREKWKESHVGASTNLKAGRGHAKHAELNRSMRHLMKIQKERVEFPSSYFFEESEQFEAFAAKLEKSVEEIGDDLEAKIGRGLEALGLSGKNTSKMLARDEAFLAWDTNKDEKISKMEWRVHIRKLPGCQNDSIHKIDELFDKFDLNKSGFINAEELEPALAAWRKHTEDIETEAAEIRNRCSELRTVAKEIRRVARITAELEAEDAKLALMKGNDPTLQSRIGKVLTLRNMKLADISPSNVQGGWDTDGNGKVDKLEFRFHVRALGSGLQAASDAELDDLFKSLDSDGSNELEMKELQRALQMWQSAAAKHVADLEEQVVVVKAMVKPVREAQERATILIDNVDMDGYGFGEDSHDC